MNTAILNTATHVIEAQHKSLKTQQAYMDWIYRFLLFHNKKQVAQFSEKQLQAFLLFLAQERKVSAATQNQALQAILFLYKHVLQIPLPDVSFLRVQKNDALPKVLRRVDVAAILSQLKGDALLMTSLLYGCGLRLNECLSLRVKDIDLDLCRICINDGKGERVLHMPGSLAACISKRLQRLRLHYDQWLQEDFCGVFVPHDMAQQFPDASLSWPWQYIFPADRPTADVLCGKPKLHHRSESFLAKAVKQAAVKAGFPESISCHVFRNSFATHLLESGCAARVVQRLLGHSSLRSTKVYTRSLPANTIVQSPLDALYNEQHQDAR